jgi:hypothetical protein
MATGSLKLRAVPRASSACPCRASRAFADAFVRLGAGSARIAPTPNPAAASRSCEAALSTSLAIGVYLHLAQQMLECGINTIDTTIVGGIGQGYNHLR